MSSQDQEITDRGIYQRHTVVHITNPSIKWVVDEIYPNMPCPYRCVRVNEEGNRVQQNFKGMELQRCES